MADVPIPARIVLAAIGLLAWWYLFRCLADTLGRRILRRTRPAPVLAPWGLFTGSFCLHGLLLGLGWRGCRVGELWAGRRSGLVAGDPALGLTGPSGRSVRRAVRNRAPGRVRSAACSVNGETRDGTVSAHL